MTDKKKVTDAYEKAASLFIADEQNSEFKRIVIEKMTGLLEKETSAIRTQAEKDLNEVKAKLERLEKAFRDVLNLMCDDDKEWKEQWMQKAGIE